MSTHQTAKTRFLFAPDGTKFGYRRIGTQPGPPLLLLIHFRGVMDKWDPLLVNSLASHRTVILYDYVGFGHSEGEHAGTMAQAGDQVLQFLQLLGESQVDILGFSIGGCVAQLVALNANPAVTKVRKLILAGTGPSIGPDSVQTKNDVPKWASQKVVALENFQTLFFPKSRAGILGSESWWDRIHERSMATSGEELKDWASSGYIDGGKCLQTQKSWMIGFQSPDASQGRNGSYNRLGELGIPVLIANGNDDYMIPTYNSWVMQQRIAHAKLIVYPDSGHGFLFQYAQTFGEEVKSFLEQ